MQLTRTLQVTGFSFLLLSGTCLFLTGCREEEASPSLATTEAVRPATHHALTRPTPAIETALQNLHKRGVSAFINEAGFGYDRLPPLHHPSRYPQLVHLPTHSSGQQQEWRVAKLELIGLARHPERVVFMKGMPHGEEKKEPTRLPDEIEKAALALLKNGSYVEVAYGHDEIRMVGAIRSRESCVECHRDAKDSLFGALSYTLRPADKSELAGK